MTNNFEGFLPNTTNRNKSKHQFCDRAIKIITDRILDNKTRDAIKYAMNEGFDAEKHFTELQLNAMASSIQEEVSLQIRRGEQHPHLESHGKFKNQKLYEQVRNE